MTLVDIISNGGLLCDGDWIEKKDQDVRGKVRLIQLADIGDGEFKDKSSKYITLETAERLHCTFLEKGDILIARLPEPLGRACIFPLEGAYITAVDIAILRIKDISINPQYIMYLINSSTFRSQIKQYESGTTRKRISRKNLEKIEFSLPNLEIQNRIVARIEELFSKLDKAVDTLKTTKEQLEVYRQAVLKDAFQEKENIIRLGDAIEKPRYGTSKKCDYPCTANSTAVLRIPNIDTKNGRVDSSDLKYAEFNEKELEQLSLKNGDILIIRSNGSISLVGSSAIIRKCDTDKTYAGYLMRLRILNKEKLLPKYLLYYLSSPDARRYIESVAKSTSGVNNINSQEISKLCVPLSSIEKQEKTVAEIEMKLSVYHEIEKSVDTVLVQADAMRQSILKQAFEGAL